MGPVHHLWLHTTCLCTAVWPTDTFPYCQGWMAPWSLDSFERQWPSEASNSTVINQWHSEELKSAAPAVKAWNVLFKIDLICNTWAFGPSPPNALLTGEGHCLHFSSLAQFQSITGGSHGSISAHYISFSWRFYPKRLTISAFNH